MRKGQGKSERFDLTRTSNYLDVIRHEHIALLLHRYPYTAILSVVYLREPLLSLYGPFSQTSRSTHKDSTAQRVSNPRTLSLSLTHSPMLLYIANHIDSFHPCSTKHRPLHNPNESLV
ncbi:hypothetical protein P280DRAFT_193791 [Massarina eburnea CBS 473.64]|uniref:Uncharacterized protein n=1 Tax=Massarina eburnea CBS 473.64 TaxID=1395130 RepID=A0A6A6RKJ6_9PLEO|nr:hypothetical protein P280DRAFT_193791 [Massarina eburnea CBS 473.64]